MKLTTLALTSIAFGSAVGMPFRPLDVDQQQARRRAIDFHPDAHHQFNRRAKRSVGYSVVQVDGGAPTSSSMPVVATPPPPPSSPTTNLQTVSGASPQDPNTRPVATPTTTPGTSSAQTITMTMTQELHQTVTATAQATTAISTRPASSPSPLFTTPVQSTIPITSLVIDRVTSTVIASQPTDYYDDGLWHTYYPVKNFMPPKSTSNSPPLSVSSLAREAAATVSSSTYISPVNSWTEYTQSLATHNDAPLQTSTWTPSSSWSSWTASTATTSATLAISSAGSAFWASAPSQTLSSPWASSRTGLNASSRQALHARKAPADLRVVNWDVDGDNHAGLH